MPKQKTKQKSEKPEKIPRGRVARRLKGYQGQVTDLGNQLESVRVRVGMLETGETEPYLAKLSQRQTKLEGTITGQTGDMQQSIEAMQAKIAEQNSVIADLLKRLEAIEKGD